MSSSAVSVRKAREAILLRTIIPLLMLAWVAVAARYYSRKLMKASIGTDDCMIVAALVRYPIVSNVPWD